MRKFVLVGLVGVGLQAGVLRQVTPPIVQTVVRVGVKGLHKTGQAVKKPAKVVGKFLF